jgi:hypothetical protein
MAQLQLVSERGAQGEVGRVYAEIRETHRSRFHQLRQETEPFEPFVSPLSSAPLSGPLPPLTPSPLSALATALPSLFLLAARGLDLSQDIGLILLPTGKASCCPTRPGTSLLYKAARLS